MYLCLLPFLDTFPFVVAVGVSNMIVSVPDHCPFTITL